MWEEVTPGETYRGRKEMEEATARGSVKDGEIDKLMSR